MSRYLEQYQKIIFIWKKILFIIQKLNNGVNHEKWVFLLITKIAKTKNAFYNQNANI